MTLLRIAPLPLLAAGTFGAMFFGRMPPARALLATMIALMPVALFPLAMQPWYAIIILALLAEWLWGIRLEWFRELRVMIGLPLAVLFAAVAISTVAGAVPPRSVATAARHLLLMLFGLLVYIQARKAGTTDWIIASVRVALLLCAAIGLGQATGLFPLRAFYDVLNPNVEWMNSIRIPGPFLDPLSFAQFVAIAGLMVSFRRRRSDSVTTALAGSARHVLLFAIAALVTALTSTRSAVAGLLGGAAYVAVTSGYRRRGIVLAVAASLVLGSVVLPQLSRTELTRRLSGDALLSGGRRVLIWQRSIRIPFDHPAGIGLGGYSTVAPAYVGIELLNFERSSLFAGILSQHPENTYLAMWYELGWIGLAGFMLLGIRVIRLLRARDAPPGGPRTEVGLEAAWVALAIIQFPTGNFLDPRIAMQNWLLLATSLAVVAESRATARVAAAHD